MDYDKFLQSKRHVFSDAGHKPKFIPSGAFDYQQYIIDLCMRKGRYGGFINTGLGKTFIQLVVAQNYAEITSRRVLIVTPLAVAFQFIQEAEKFGICEPKYSKDGTLSSDIVICNYERLGKFNPSDFDTVILDESSILKNFKGSIKSQITAFMRKVKYRYLFTATPSPNDFVELGTSSEALGYLGYTDMLGRFFTNNENTVDPVKLGAKWVLKGHAEKSFFEWVSSWSMFVRKPSDIGFSDDNHILPELRVNSISVRNESPLFIDNQGEMFARPSTRLTEVRQEQKQTINERCERAAQAVSERDCSVVWCNYNDEAAALMSLIDGAQEIKGSMDLDRKEELLIAFQKGEISKLITKPRITCFGLNWQHCNHTVYFPTFSYEQYYQAIRRFWRFGQKKPVDVDLIYGEGQEKVLQALKAKADKASRLFDEISSTINELNISNETNFTNSIRLPEFI